MNRDHEDTAGATDDTALSDLRTMVLDLKREWAAFNTDSDESSASPRGFTRRAEKSDRRMKQRDCPNGGKGGVSAQSFSSEDIENSVFAARFQRANVHRTTPFGATYDQCDHLPRSTVSNRFSSCQTDENGVDN
ncbi:hypothetical protein CYMTET_51710 [Cymbomonas tetramitiformis]|uniref:Uncharacterized protein n=1 Tax=Cymbomonas tetramitiformis TaxID=36881 RepID=A0AAE0ERU3_9CHLO|nr:hypothetical protein CYMTET_51710 [Cymbomonas tetramitiformis]